MMNRATAAKYPAAASAFVPFFPARRYNSYSPRTIAAAARTTKSGCNQETKMDAIRKGRRITAVMMRDIQSLLVLFDSSIGAIGPIGPISAVLLIGDQLQSAESP